MFDGCTNLKKHNELEKLVNYIKDTLEENKQYLYGAPERSDDLYICGTVDGEYNALINILNLLEIPNDYMLQS